MIRSPIARIITAVGGLLIFGIALKLLVSVLQSVLPDPLLGLLNAGLGTLYGLLSGAFPSLAAMAILAAVTWAAMAWLRRN